MSDEMNYNAPQEEKKGMSIASLVLGCCGVIAWCIPLFGYPVTITGIVLGCIGMKKGGKTFAIIGIILSAIFFIATIISSAIGVMSAMSQMGY